MPSANSMRRYIQRIYERESLAGFEGEEERTGGLDQGRTGIGNGEGKGKEAYDDH